MFLVTNFWEPGTDELKQATAAVRAAKDAGVEHLIWSTLPDVQAISGGKFHVAHFTGKAKIDRLGVCPRNVRRNFMGWYAEIRSWMKRSATTIQEPSSGGKSSRATF